MQSKISSNASSANQPVDRGLEASVNAGAHDVWMEAAGQSSLMFSFVVERRNTLSMVGR
jgi:hypothetical protein